MKLFRRVPLSFFTPERADELEEFAEKAQLFAAQEGEDANYLVDLLTGDEVLWDEFLQEPWVRERNPITDARGSLDMLVAFIAEDCLGLREAWDNVSWARYQEFQKDLSRSGLHGLHFRLGINEAIDRVEHTKTLALTLYKMNKESFCNTFNALHGLSLFEGCREVEASYSTLRGMSKAASMEDIHLLLSGAQGVKPDDYRAALKNVLFGKVLETDRVQTHVIFQVENAFVPLVYNYGYLLKSKGESVEDIRNKASANIDALLGFLKLEPPVKSAIKRQVLINLFSPFPEGLELMHATTEEMQGAFLDPVLKGHPCTAGFGYTLCGPVAVFGAEVSARKAERRTQIVDYFKETSYPIDFEVAIRGRLSSSEIIVDLFSAYCNGHSLFMDQTLSGQLPEVFIQEDLMSHLLHRDRVRLYSDAAVLALVTRLISHVQAPGSRNPQKFLEADAKSLDLTFKDRPHLRDEVLQLLIDHKCLTKDMFEWLGFGHRELKKVGREAPNELKQFVLQDALGL
jgi:hypothetical protein